MQGYVCHNDYENLLLEMEMENRVLCRNCQSMPKELPDGSFKTFKGKCPSGEVWWHSEIMLRCSLFKPKMTMTEMENEVTFWE